MVTWRIVAAIGLVAQLVLSQAQNVGAAEPAADYAAIDRYVPSQLEANRFPGVAIAVVDGASLADVQGFGRDAQGQLVTAETPLMIGSNSKSFTALAIMQLADAGTVDLNAPVQRYVPDFQLAEPGANSRITVRQLLNQTSGIPATAAGDMLLEFQDASLQQGLAALSAAHMHAPPGTEYQ